MAPSTEADQADANDIAAGEPSISVVEESEPTKDTASKKGKSAKKELEIPSVVRIPRKVSPLFVDFQASSYIV